MSQSCVFCKHLKTIPHWRYIILITLNRNCRKKRVSPLDSAIPDRNCFQVGIGTLEFYGGVGGGAECLSSLFCGIRFGTIREVMDDDATISGIDSCDMGADRTLHGGIVARNCKSGNA